MSVEVRWFSTLVKRTRSNAPRTTVSWREGISPRTIFKDEGFDDADADHVIAIANGEQVDMNTQLNDGDELEFLVGISGG
jgi:molybdopterin converting factor small subunit